MIKALLVLLVVVTAQVEETMDGEMREVVQEGRALRIRFALCGFVGDHDITQ